MIQEQVMLTTGKKKQISRVSYHASPFKSNTKQQFRNIYVCYAFLSTFKHTENYNYIEHIYNYN